MRCQHSATSFGGNAVVQFFGNGEGSCRITWGYRAPLVLSIFPLQSLKDVSNSGRLEKHTGVLYVSLRISERNLTLALAGLAFVAYWGIVLFGYDTCVTVKVFTPGSDAFFILSEVSGTLKSSNMWV